MCPRTFRLLIGASCQRSNPSRGSKALKSSYDEWLIMKRCMYSVCRPHMRDGAIHYKLYLIKLTMAVDNIVFRIIKGAF